jgi:hypothetical protein
LPVAPFLSTGLTSFLGQNALLKEQTLSLRRENAVQVQSLQTQVRTLEAAASLSVNVGSSGARGLAGTAPQRPSPARPLY